MSSLRYVRIVPRTNPPLAVCTHGGSPQGRQLTALGGCRPHQSFRHAARRLRASRQRARIPIVTVNAMTSRARRIASRSSRSSSDCRCTNARKGARCVSSGTRAGCACHARRRRQTGMRASRASLLDRAIPSIAERLSQAPDRLSEAVLGHGRVPPGRLDERLSRDDFVNVGDELDQNRGLRIRQWDAPRSAKQAAARGIELEGPETVHPNAARHDE